MAAVAAAVDDLSGRPRPASSGFDAGALQAGSGPASVTVAVNGGAGSGTHPVGSVITLTAGAAPAGQMFHRWRGDITRLRDVYAAETQLLVPDRDFILTAQYKAFEQMGGVGVDQPAGTYAAPIDIALVPPQDGAHIRFTLDGSEPSRSHGKLWLKQGSLTIDATTTLKTFAWAPDYADSPVQTFLYDFNSAPAPDFLLIEAEALTWARIDGAGQPQSAAQITDVSRSDASGGAMLDITLPAAWSTIATISGLTPGDYQFSMRYRAGDRIVADIFVDDAKLLSILNMQGAWEFLQTPAVPITVGADGTLDLRAQRVNPSGPGMITLDAFELAALPAEPRPQDLHDAWALARWPEADATQRQPSASNSASGMANLLLYALGASADSDHFPNPPRLELTQSMTGETVPVLTFQRIADPGLIYRLLASPDLSANS